MTQEDAYRILKQTKRGVMAINTPEGYPYAVPLNHYFDEQTGILYFHGGMIGHRIECLEKDGRVSFCAYKEKQVQEKHWYITWESVIAFGKVRMIEDENIKKDIIRKLSAVFTDDDESIEQEISEAIKSTSLMEMSIEHITAKFIDEK